jgi:HD-like signal output (HDOD) protein
MFLNMKKEDLKIPPRPQLLTDFQAAMDKAEPQFSEIATIIKRDPSVAGMTIKLVNSPVFGLKAKISSIEHACKVLGLKKLKMLITSVLVRYAMGSDEHPFINQLWDTSLAVASTAAALAKGLGLTISDEMYLLGMFHNVGKHILFQQYDNYPQVLQQAYAQDQCNISIFEEQEIGTSHEVVGYLVAENWGLPLDLCSAIMYHHQYDLVKLSATKPVKEMIVLLNVSEHACGLHKIFSPGAADQSWQKYQQEFLDVLHIDKNQLVELLKSNN